ncbi:MAG: hypothetical protein GY820_28110 [Gammaproteobacteria bacterium]|nr:hypothetical protein [Gammaproteobacteria bacterium]
MAKPLSDKEEKYCQAYILQGGGKVKAYEAAGYSMNMSQASISSQAEKVFKKPHINHRITELQKGATKAVIMTKEKKLLILEKLINACVTPDADKGVINATAVTAAIKEHNLMQGDNSPLQVETKTVKSFSDMYN